MKTLYLAGGCFWGLQKFFDGADGVLKTEVGYANGRTENPTYEQVKYQHTGHAETVKILYDETKLSTERLLDRFLQVIDPYSVNRQGEDVGEQYRTGVYSDDAAVLDFAKEKIAALERASGKKCAVEVKRIDNFFPAEEYHQKYLEKNPSGYCHIHVAF